MTIVGTIEGAGVLTSHGRASQVRYDIRVREIEGRITAEGVLSGEARAMVAAANSPQAVLRLSNDGELAIVVGFYDAITGKAQFKVIGTIHDGEAAVDQSR